MGLYIPNVKLPADGDFELWIAVRKDGSFTYNIRGSWQDGKQKAIPVQEPHGKLIDANTLDVVGYCGIPQGCEDTFDSGVMWLAERIDELPTIILASEEG